MKTTRTTTPRADGARRPDGAGPSYAWLAFANPYNLSLFVGGASLAVYLGNLPLASAVAAAEVIWLVFAPDSKLLRRVWFDRVADATRDADEGARVTARMAELTQTDQARARALSAQKARIVAQAQTNDSITAQLTLTELERLDGLVADFVDLGVRAARCERHLAAFDFAALNRSWLLYARQLDELGMGDPRREVAEKNAAVLRERRARYDDLVRTLQATRGQMELVENTLSLLGDDIVTMADRGDIGSRLDELRVAMDAVREVHAASSDFVEDPESSPRLRRAG